MEFISRRNLVYRLTETVLQCLESNYVCARDTSSIRNGDFPPLELVLLIEGFLANRLSEEGDVVVEPGSQDLEQLSESLAFELFLFLVSRERIRPGGPDSVQLLPCLKEKIRLVLRQQFC